MATVSDDIVFRLTAEMEKFNAPMKQAAGSVERLQKQVETASAKMKSALSSLFTVGAIVGAATAFARMSSQVEQAALDLSNVAANANVGVETLQELRFAAEQAGAEASDMDAVLLNLNKRLGEARAGSEEAAKQFHALGLEQLVKNGADTETMLRAIADQLRQIEDPALADAIAMKILGDNAKVLNGLLREGSGKLAEYATQAREVGIQTRDQVEELKAAALETKKLNAFFNQLAADVDIILLRSLKGATLALQDLATAMRGFREENERQKNQGFLGSSVNQILEDARNFGKVPAPPTIGFEALDLGKPKFTPRPLGPMDDGGAAAKLAENLKRLREENERLVESLEFEVSIMNLSEGEQEVQIALRKLNAEATDEQVTKTEALTRALFENAQALRDNAELEAFAERIKDQYGDTSEKLAENIERLNRALAAGKVSIETYRKALEDLTKDPAVKEFEEEWKQIGETIQDSMANAFVDIVDGSKNVKEALADLLRDIGRLIAKWLILKAIQGATDPLFGITRIPGLAAGGPMQAGRPYLVGEQGPELVIPRMSGFVVPNHRLGGGGGGHVFAPVYNIAPGVTSADVRTMLHQHDRELLPRFLNAVDDKVRRSSTYATRR